MEVIGTDFENWSPYLMKQFQLMYEKGEKCDLEISCNKQIFLVHRLIMSACSEYVKELGDKQHIILPEEVSCKALKMVLDFVYSGKIVFSKEEKDDLLLASNLLNMRLLTELIKMEESCSFTLSMDEESEEKPKQDACSGNVESQDVTDTNVSEPTVVPQVSNRTNSKKKSEVKSSRSRSNKHSVLPPLHKFPYLQQKFSASRTYGLITTQTEPAPSLFKVPDSMMSECACESSFEDVSYETDSLCRESESFAALESQHLQFLKKNRDSFNHKRSYSNALYSPFDMHTPSCAITTENIPRKRESSSYLSKSDIIPPKKSAPPIKTSDGPKYHYKNIKTVVAPVNVIVEQPPLIENPSVSTDAAMALNLFNNAVKNKLPEKSPEIIEVPSVENGEKVELIKLNNAVVTTVEEDFKVRSLSEELPDVSISVIDSENGIEKSEVDENLNNGINLPEATNFSSEFSIPSISEINIATATSNSVTPQTCFNLSDSTSFPDDGVDSSCILPDCGTDSMETPENILPDTATVSSQNTVVADVLPDANSQIFAVNAKGTDNPAHLSKLVEDLCKKSPLLKNKNVRFKIVPVKGPIPDILKDQARANINMLNKAIIVKKTESSLKSEVAKEADDKSTKKTENVKLPSIENVIGPWECKICKEGENYLKFDTYLEYRTHLHDLHGEPNNPMYCMHCGYKSLKRNMQVYHLFTKHNVEPPSSFKFPKCDKCEFYALNEYYLQKHLACHPSGGMEYVCACKVAFKTSEALQKHIVSGDCKNSKSFTCGYCRCMFDRFVNLKAHMRVCMKERSKPPILQINDNPPALENVAKTISEGGKDYLAL